MLSIIATFAALLGHSFTRTIYGIVVTKHIGKIGESIVQRRGPETGKRHCFVLVPCDIRKKQVNYDCNRTK